MRFHEQKGDVCPANWSQGDEGMNPTQDGVVDYLTRFAKDKAEGKTAPEAQAS